MINLDIETLLRATVDMGASDLHLTVGIPPGTVALDEVLASLS
jgi:Tfp pilus assembly pilus retraction ATPase PilT